MESLLVEVKVSNLNGINIQFPTGGHPHYIHFSLDVLSLTQYFKIKPRNPELSQPPLSEVNYQCVPPRSQ